MRSQSLGSSSVQASGIVRPERSRRALVRRSCKPADPVPVTSDQRFLLGACPPLDSALERERFISGRSGFTPDELDRSPSAGPVAAYPLLVLPEPRFKVFGMTGIVRTVAAAEQTDPELHGRRAFALRLRSGRTNLCVCPKAKPPPPEPHIPLPLPTGRRRTRGYALPRCSAAEARARHCPRPPPSAARACAGSSRRRGCRSSS